MCVPREEVCGVRVAWRGECVVYVLCGECVVCVLRGECVVCVLRGECV